MNKKSKLIMIFAAVIAISMFAVTALASTPKTSGYDAFKEVLKANALSADAVQSATVSGSFSVKLDDEIIVDAAGTMKAKEAGDEGEVSGSFDFTLLGVERSGSIYKKDNDNVYFVDETHDLHYQLINNNRKHSDWYEDNDWYEDKDFYNGTMTKTEEALLDFVVGNLKNNFSVAHHTDGAKTITLDVNKEQVPLPIRLLVDAASSAEKHSQVNSKEDPEWELLKQFPFFQGFEEAILADQSPEVTHSVAIEHVQIQLTVNEQNELLSMQGLLKLSGKDKDNVTHQIEVMGKSEFSHINATTPDVYDPAGKHVEIIDAATFDDYR